MAFLARISVFPVKSMPAVEVDAVRVVSGGGLENDRVIALFDAAGKFVNGKRTAAVHGLSMRFDPALRTLRLARKHDAHERIFELDRDAAAIDGWLGEYFGFPVFVRQSAGGFPDDSDSPGPTLISTATLREVAGWFPGLTLDGVRARFRTNLEIDGVEPFWEDRLYGPAGRPVRFCVGDVELDGINPCQRCAVPPRDPATGEVYPQFTPTFLARRKATLPPWVERSRFNHFYRLAINTIVPGNEAGKRLRVGDPVELS